MVLENIAKVLGFSFKETGSQEDYKRFLRALYSYLSGKDNFSLKNLARLLGFSFSPKGDDCIDTYNFFLSLYRFLGGKETFSSPYFRALPKKFCMYLGGGGSGDAFHCFLKGSIICESYNGYVLVISPGNGKISGSVKDGVYHIADSDIYSVVSQGLKCPKSNFDMFVDCNGSIGFRCGFSGQRFSVSLEKYMREECGYSVHNDIAEAIFYLLGGGR